MIVPDASLVVELLVNSSRAELIRRELAVAGDILIAPHLLDIEVASALRNLAAGRRIGRHRIEQFWAELAALPLRRYPHTPLLGRIWELRNNFTAYDAAYISLAEATGSVLYTCDEKLRRGHRARVVVII